MIKTLVIAYFATSAVLWILAIMSVRSMKKQALAEGYTFPKQQRDFCRRFLALVLSALIFCCPVARFIGSLGNITAAVFGMDTDYEIPSKAWDAILDKAEWHYKEQ